jgi:plasmid stabilization system protein ParE
MVMRIEWSALAERQLKGIFDYYSIEVSPRVAKRIVNRIIGRVTTLAISPYTGQKEELLEDYPEDYRYLVESNYKIVCWIKQDLVTISSVFDCRQNAQKIKFIY